MIIVAGPNGSGKSTTTEQFSKEGYQVIDPDRMARNISPNNPESSAVTAGRQAINQARENISQGNSFLVETTLSSKGVYQRLVDSALDKGFLVKLAYIATERPEINIARVADRVSKGGHHVPDNDVTRRYYRSLDNLPDFFKKADEKTIIDNSQEKNQVQLDIRGNKVVYMEDKSKLANWVIDSLGEQRIHAAMKNYISHDSTSLSPFYTKLREKVSALTQDQVKNQSKADPDIER